VTSDIVNGRMDGFPRSVDRLVRDRRLLLYAGILSDGYHAPGDGVAWIPSLLGLPIPALAGSALRRFDHSFTHR